MGADLVSDSAPSEGGQEPPSFAYVFEKYAPYYLSIGMSYELYWHGDCTAVKAFREAEKMRAERVSYEAWLQGKYFYDALLESAPLYCFGAKNPKPMDYNDEPYAVTKEMQEEQEERREKKRYEQIRSRMMRAVEQTKNL